MRRSIALSFATILFACTGSQGEPGPTGATGAEGKQGAKGDQGNVGPKGDPGPSGDAGPIGATGPQGDVGPTGAQGDAGPPGPQGDAGPPGANGSGVVWKDATGQRVPYTNALGSATYYYADVWWTLDASLGGGAKQLRPTTDLTRATQYYVSTDCSGAALIDTRTPRFTFATQDDKVRVVQDDAVAANTTVHSLSTAAGQCSTANMPQTRVVYPLTSTTIVGDVSSLPSPSVTLPLHPEFVP